MAQYDLMYVFKIEKAGRYVRVYKSVDVQNQEENLISEQRKTMEVWKKI